MIQIADEYSTKQTNLNKVTVKLENISEVVCTMHHLVSVTSSPKVYFMQKSWRKIKMAARLLEMHSNTLFTCILASINGIQRLC